MQTVTLKLAAITTDGEPAQGRITLTYDGGLMLDGDTAVYPRRLTKNLMDLDQIENGEKKVVGYAEFTVPASNADLPGSGGTYTATVELSDGSRSVATFPADKAAPKGVIWISRFQSVDPDPGTHVTVVTYDDVRGWVADATEVMVTGGKITGDNLVLTRADKTEVIAGNVRGPRGDPGPVGSQVPMRVDTSAGTRVFATIGGKEHLLSSTTGRREISGMLERDYSARSMLLSRHGTIVTLEITDLAGPEGDFIRLPAGFRTKGWTQFVVSDFDRSKGTVPVIFGTKGSSGSLAGLLYCPRVSKTQGVLTWETSDLWPANLPGTAA